MQNQNNYQLSRQATLWILLVIVLLTIVLRFNLLNVPLERDEGEYAYGGQLILQGIPPYQGLYNMKLPGIYAAYAGILKIFGQTDKAIHLGLLFINISTITLLFFLTKRIAGPLAGVAAAAFFSALSVGQAVQGVFANAEHFVVLPAIGGLLLLDKGVKKNLPWLLLGSGVLLGIGFIIKQHGAVFIAMGVFYILFYHWRSDTAKMGHLTQKCVFFLLGALLPYGLTCLILWQAGVFTNFWFWTVDYARAYTTLVSYGAAFVQLKNQVIAITGAAPLIWVLAVLGIPAIFWDSTLRKQAPFLLLFATFSFLATCPGFYFRPHYFIFTLPVAAMLAGIATSTITDTLLKNYNRFVRNGLPLAMITIFLAATVYQQRTFLFQLSPVQASRVTYWPNPFPESLEISRYIREHSKVDDRIAVIGSEPQIYFYSQRRSATGYIYMYALMEDHAFAAEMQQEMIREVEEISPKFLIFVRIKYSWLQTENSPTLLFDWYKKYGAEHYTRVGLIDIFGDTTLYHWQPDNIPWPPRSPYWIEVMERKEEPEF